MCCDVAPVTYWGLRDYGITPMVWGGDSTCAHAWGAPIPLRGRSSWDTFDGYRTDGTIRGGEGKNHAGKDGSHGTVCHCGAWRGTLGLEPTPALYVEHMVQVFREVWRVLRDDGTLWLNLGDSYASKPAGSNGFHDGRTNRDDRRSGGVPDGLKPKDLVGIPWLVAKALQAPYYAGRIADVGDRRWLAAMIDGEGTICGFHHVRRDDGRPRTGAHVFITNGSTALLDEAQRIWPTSRSEHMRPGAGHLGTITTYRWIIHGIENKTLLLRELYPYLIAKKRQAVVAYNLLLLMADAKRLGHTEQRDPVRDKRKALTDLLSALNHGVADLPSWLVEPPSLYEPGWYLRSDVIWSKPNPMPESVTDRPTKAHEYLFLLTKRERYFYDAEAIKEPAVWGQPNSPESIKSPYGQGFTRRSNNFVRGDHRLTHAESSEDPYVATADSRRNRRSVWTIPTEPYPEAHFATFPTDLVKPCVLAATSEKGACVECGAPWERVIHTSYYSSTYGDSRHPDIAGSNDGKGRQREYQTRGFDERMRKETQTRGWRPTCAHDAPTRPCVVFDPFVGSGTTVLVAKDLGRHAIGCDLKWDYLQLARDRTCQGAFRL